MMQGLYLKDYLDKCSVPQEKALFISKFDLNLKKKLVRCLIWNIVSHNAVILTFQKVGQK